MCDSRVQGSFSSFKAVEKGASKDKADSPGARRGTLAAFPTHLKGMMVANQGRAIFPRKTRHDVSVPIQ
jgi:hypothetical protein